MRLCSKEKKNFTVNFGTREKISQKDGGILTVVREQAGLPSPGSVTSLQKSLRPLFTFQKCPSKAATASKAGKICPGKSGTPENSRDNRGTPVSLDSHYLLKNNELK